jgi:glycosyltransferase involved in cell wall biosynthesis
MHITACYIVRNEEQNIRRSIESLKDVCAEIVVVDTGSEDATVKTAKELGAYVYHFEWVNDFSKARNYALSKAKGDIVIFLDADEWFAYPLTQEHVRHLTAELASGADVFTLPFRNISGQDVSETFFLTRIFRNNTGIQYIEPIHETINKTANSKRLPDSFLVYHSGYEADVFEHKLKRNLHVLKARLKDEKSQIHRIVYSFYIARESLSLSRLEDASHHLKLFFGQWSPQKYPTIQNIAIAAHQLRIKLVSENPEYAPDDEVCEGHVGQFIKEFPTHPVSRFSQAQFYYARQGDFRRARAAIREMEALAQSYDPKFFPNDITNIELFMRVALAMKAAVEYGLGDQAAALDTLIRLFKNYAFDEKLFLLLLHIIKRQPAAEIIAFIQALVGEPSVTELEGMLRQLLYFPTLKDVYIHYCMAHIKKTQRHSGLSAIASLVEKGHERHAIKMARDLSKTDKQSSDALLCAALFCANDATLYESLPKQTRIDRLLAGYFSDIALENFTVYELAILSEVAKILLFIDREAVSGRMMKLMEGYTYERYLMRHNYSIMAQDYHSILQTLDFDPDTLPPLACCNTHLLLGIANRELHLYDASLGHFEKALLANPNNRDIHKECRVLYSMAPKHEQRVNLLIQKSRRMARAPEQG